MLGHALHGEALTSRLCSVQIATLGYITLWAPAERQALHAWPKQEALRRLGLPARSQDYMADLLKQYDRDGDGRIDWGEFHAYVARKERVVKRTFRQLDADGSGNISPDELVSKGAHPLCMWLCLFCSHRWDRYAAWAAPMIFMCQGSHR